MRVRLPAPPGQTRILTLARLLKQDNLSVIARDLGIHRSTVQQHRDALLACGALVVSNGRYRPGSAYAVEMGGAGSDRTPPANVTGPYPHPRGAPWQVTDGQRTFEILAHVSDAAKVPGFKGTDLRGRSADDSKKRQDHSVKWTNGGHTFDMLLMHQPTKNTWSLTLKKVRPPPFLSAIQKDPDEDVELTWDRFTLDNLVAWGQAGGVQVCPDVSRVRRSKRVSLALPGVADPDVKIKSHDFDVDGTPDLGTVEVRTKQLKSFVETGPEVLEELGRRIDRVTDQVNGLSELVAKEANLAEKIAGVQADQARAVAGVLAAITPTRPPLPITNPGVEYQ